jgi:hypothetical protein
LLLSLFSLGKFIIRKQELRLKHIIVFETSQKYVLKRDL